VYLLTGHGWHIGQLAVVFLTVILGVILWVSGSYWRNRSYRRNRHQRQALLIAAAWRGHEARLRYPDIAEHSPARVGNS
jgi:hypothetical protein